MMMTHGSGGVRATLQLADPRVEEAAEYELTRGPFEYGGTSAPHGSGFVMSAAHVLQSEVLKDVVSICVPLCQGSDAIQSEETLDEKSIRKCFCVLILNLGSLRVTVSVKFPDPEARFAAVRFEFLSGR